MAAAYNRIVLVGNLTRDPEYKQIASGQSMCRLGLSTSRSSTNRQTGNTTQEVCFIDIDVWGAQADSCRQYLSKGSSALIEGRLKFDSWDDQQTGQKRSKHSVVAERVVFLGTGADTEVSLDNMNQAESIKTRIQSAAQPSLQDDLPF